MSACRCTDPVAARCGPDHTCWACYAERMGDGSIPEPPPAEAEARRAHDAEFARAWAEIEEASTDEQLTPDLGAAERLAVCVRLPADLRDEGWRDLAGRIEFGARALFAEARLGGVGTAAEPRRVRARGRRGGTWRCADTGRCPPVTAGCLRWRTAQGSAGHRAARDRRALLLEAPA